MPRHFFLPLLGLLPCLAAGCHLVDQRTFDAHADRPPAPRIAAPATAAAPALVTIRYTTPEPPYHEALAGAVHRALARKPDVLFTVTTLVPGAAASPDVQAATAADASASGRAVAQAIVDDGAEPGQVEQAVRVQPGVAVREVRVTVQ